MYSLPLHRSFCLLLWVYEATLPKHGFHFKQLLNTYKSKSTNYMYFDRLLGCLGVRWWNFELKFNQ